MNINYGSIDAKYNKKSDWWHLDHYVLSVFLASILKSVLACAIRAFAKEAGDSRATLVKYVIFIQCIETSSDNLSRRAGISQLQHLGNLSNSSLEPGPKHVPLLSIPLYRREVEVKTVASVMDLKSSPVTNIDGLKI